MFQFVVGLKVRKIRFFIVIFILSDSSIVKGIREKAIVMCIFNKVSLSPVLRFFIIEMNSCSSIIPFFIQVVQLKVNYFPMVLFYGTIPVFFYQTVNFIVFWVAWFEFIMKNRSWFRYIEFKLTAAMIIIMNSRRITVSFFFIEDSLIKMTLKGCAIITILISFHWNHLPI